MNGVIDFATLATEHKGKLDASQRSNVEFKPSKKMKKRRQLDALVVNSKLPRRKHSGHELLRSNDSDSSDVEEFRVLEGHKLGKRWSGSSCCSTCSALTGFIVLATCLVASASLIWMHLELKRDFSNLQERLVLVENKNAGTPEELQLFQSKLIAVNKTVQEMSTGKYGLLALNKSIEEMKKQIESLTTAASLVAKSQASDHGDLGAESQSLQISALTKTVADIGSEVTRMKTDMDQLKSETSKQLDNLTNRLVEVEGLNGREGVKSAISSATQNLMSQFNATLLQNLEEINLRYSSLEAHVGALGKVTTDLQEQLKNLTSAVQNISQSLQVHATNSPHQEDILTTDEKSTQLAAQVEAIDKHVQFLDEVLSQFRNENGSHRNNDAGGKQNDSILSELKHDHQDFLIFKAEAFQDISSLNASATSLNLSVMTLNTDLNELTSRLEDSMQHMSNMSSVVEKIVTFLQTHVNASEEIQDVRQTERIPSGEHNKESDEKQPELQALTTAVSGNGFEVTQESGMQPK